MRYTHHDSPIGTLLLVGTGEGLAGVYMEQHARGPDVARAWTRDDFSTERRQLDEYFAGTRRRFELRLAPLGTPFQLRVWDQLRAIDFGRTRTYGEIAIALGKPTASRAVGAANGRNPLSIIVPCHRVIGQDGSLTGYAGGEDRKRWLLEHERRVTS